MRTARVAVYGGRGAPFHYATVLRRAGYRVDFVFQVDVVDGPSPGSTSSSCSAVATAHCR